VVTAGANDMEKGRHGESSFRFGFGNPAACILANQRIYVNIIYVNLLDEYTLVLDSEIRMKKDPSEDADVHVWLVLGKAFHAMTKFTMAGIQESGLGDSDFRVLEALLHKGPLPVNVIGPKVFLTPGSISTAVDRLFSKGLVSREENPEDRRIRLVALTESGKALIRPIYRKHVEDVRQVFADFTLSELRQLERLMKKTGRKAEAIYAASGRQADTDKSKS
jgi:MarR family transcriptional regulator, 2-MHQ and catechol-resistance regulon repressor